MKDTEISIFEQKLYYAPTFHTIYTEEGFRQYIMQNEFCVNSWSARHPMFELIDTDKYIEEKLFLPIYKTNAKKELNLLDHRIQIETNIKHTASYLKDGKIYIDLYTSSEAGYDFFSKLLEKVGTDFSKDFFYLSSVAFIKQDRDNYWSDTLRLELGVNIDNVEYCFDNEYE